MLSESEVIDLIASELAMIPAHVASIIRTAPLRYKVFHIEKKSGGKREVAQPAREVKTIQRWIVRNIGPHLPIHAAATAYIAGGSIKKNACQHVDGSYLLKMDFTNFFPSVLRSDIIEHMRSHCAERFDESAIKLEPISKSRRMSFKG